MKRGTPQPKRGSNRGLDKRLVGLLFALVATQIGGVCDGTPMPDPGAAAATLKCAPTNVYKAPGATFTIALQFDTAAQVQAVDLDVKYDPAHIKFLSIGPHPEFDDDGQLFPSVVVDESAGKIRDIRDSRHGPTSLSGKKKVASIQFRVETSQPSTIVATGQVADPQGVRSAGLTATCYVSAGQI